MMLKNILLLVLVGLTAARRNASPFLSRSSKLFDTPKNKKQNKALLVRGGAGPLNPTDTAKLATALVGVQGALSVMSPSRTLDVYGLPSSPLLELFAHRHGLTLLSFAAMAYQLLFKDADLPTAVGLAAIPWILEFVKCFWNDDPKKYGFPAAPQAVVLAILGAATYATLSGGDYADAAVKFISGWNIAIGLLTVLAPEKAVEMWGVTDETGVSAAMKSTGYVLTGLGIYEAALAFGVDSLQAFGYSWIPALIMQIEANFFSDEEFAKGPSMVWLLIDAIVVVTCGVKLGGKVEASPTA